MFNGQQRDPCISHVHNGQTQLAATEELKSPFPGSDTQLLYK